MGFKTKLKNTVLMLFMTGIIYSCNPTNVLRYKYNPLYSNDNPRFDSVLFQGVFLKSHKPDRGSWPGLHFILLDSAKANTLHLIDLEKDTSIIKCTYYRLCYCSKLNEQYTLSGTIQILKWNYNKIKFRENISIVDKKRNETITYKGTCKFKRR